MADRSYIVEILLKARDDTARAFASATGQLEAYDKLLDEQKTKTKEAQVANERYVRELNERTKSEERLSKALKDSKLRNVEAAQAALHLRDAQRGVAKAESENDPAKRAVALGKVVSAQNDLVNALAEENDARRGWATVVSNQIAHEAALQARLEQTAKQQERDTQAQQNRQKLLQQLTDSITRETERVRLDSNRRIEQSEQADERRRLSRIEESARMREGEAKASQKAHEDAIKASQKLEEQKEADFTRIIGLAHRPAQTLARTDVSQREEINATRELANFRALLIQRGHEEVAVDTAIHNVRQDALRDYSHENQVARDAARLKKDEAEAWKLVDNAVRKVNTSKREAERVTKSGSGVITPVAHDVRQLADVDLGHGRGSGSGFTTPQPPQQSGWQSFLGVINQAKKEFADLDTSTSGFTTHLRGAFGFAAVTLIQPLIALIVGLVAAFASLASAAVAAGGAIGTIFLSGIAQGIPVIGVFAVALQRLSGVFNLISAQLAQQQQKFTAGFITAVQNALGINQIAIAQHNLSNALYAQSQATVQVTFAQHGYSDALYSLSQAEHNVQVAELQLRETRQQATRQLQDLIFQEIQARLAAEASSLAITNSQKALRSAIATGGDVQGAQLQLAQAQANHVQAVTQAQRSIADAAPRSIARQGIQEQVTQGSRAVQQAQRAVVDAEYALRQASIGVVQAERAVIDARFQVAQARAAIIQAQQAAAGYNIATAAQLAYLRSQMSRTELALAGSITRILGLFRGANAYMRPITDAILGAFIPLTDRIYQLLKDPRIFGALKTLADSIGGAIRVATRALSDRSAINGFVNLINAASRNIGPFSRIIIDLIRSAGAIANAAIPFVHQFLLFIAGVADRFSAWAQSARGQNWLRNFFDVAFRSLNAFIRLALSIGRLVLDIVGVGGGAQSGINILKELQKWVDSTASSIEHHGRVFKELRQLWSIAVPTVRALGSVLGAIGNALLKLAVSRQGQASFQGFVNLITHILIPAFVQFVQITGRVTNAILGFLKQHPALQRFLVTFIAVSASLAIGFKAVGLLFGPLAAIIGLIPRLAALIEALKIIKVAIAAIDTEAAIAFLAPLAPIALIVAAIVGLSVVTGNFHNLLKTLASPFIAFWNQVRVPLENLQKQFLYFINGVLAPFGVHVKNIGQLFHGVFAGILSVVRTVFSEVGNAVGRIFGNAFRVIGDFFRILGDLTRGRFGAVLNDFKKLGGDIVKGLFDSVTAIPRLMVRLFIDMVNAILKWLGISSPSKRFRDIGQAMVDGLWNGIKALGQFAARILGWLGEGIANVISWVIGLGGRILGALWHGIVNLAKTYFNFEKWLWTTIFNAVWSILRNVENLGEKIVDAIIRGIKKAPRKIINAVKSLIPQPLKDAANTVGGLLPWNWNKGGAVPGYGGGDIIASRLEPGEHVFTKEEVHAAGGHGPLFALRRSLGGGTQGGPFGYAQGGAIISQDIGSQGPARVTQGVTGQLGSVLANIRLFITQFEKDWSDLWAFINKATLDNINVEDSYFKNFFQNIQSKWQGLNDSLTATLRNFWQTLNQNAQEQLNKLLTNFDWTYRHVDTDSFNAIWYILRIVQQSLDSFGQKFTIPHLDKQPQMTRVATGGRVGNAGERGSDAVTALLGRGEAVLNYAHQAIVEPAMNAFYGFGLDKMFQRTGALHAGRDDRGYASGGYVWPFGGAVNWERTDQGVDFSMAPGTKIGPLGKAKVIGIIKNWYQNQPYIWWQLLDGPDKGKYAFVAEQITNLAAPGQILNANDAVARYASHGTGIEYGFATPSGATLAKVTGGYTEGQATAAGAAMHALLQALSSGAHVPILGGGPQFASAARATPWQNIARQAVVGAGALANLLRKSIGKVTDAANAFGASKAPAAGAAVDASGTPVPQTGNYANAVKWTEQAMKLAGVSGPLWEKTLLRQEFKESGYNPNAINKTDINAQRGDPSRGILQTIMATFARYALPGFNKNIYDPVSNIISAIRYMIANYGGGNADRAAQVMWGRGGGAYAEGGFVGKARPIIAHVGEWVVNQVQQSKLANWLGTSREGLKGSLGFSGGPDSFAGGGEVGLQPTFSRTTGVLQDPALVEASESLSFVSKSVATVNRAEAFLSRMITSLRKQGDNIDKALGTYLDNLSQLVGDGGILTLAAQALDDFASRQSTFASLAANGIRRTVAVTREGGRVIRTITERLRRTTPETVLQVATDDLRRTQTIGDDLDRLHRQEVVALSGVRNQLDHFGKVTSANLKQYQRLIGLRKTLTDQIADTDSKIAQNAQDQIDKQQTRFQATVDQQLRGTTTLNAGQIGSITLGVRPGSGVGALQSSFNNLRGILSKVGPNIALGLAQMAQTIAQTLGDPDKLRISDQEVINASERQREALQEAYTRAAQRAQKDPRWQKVADDLLGQLESATTAVVQAQAQALTDAIQAQDTRAQIQTAALDFRNRLAQVVIGLGDNLGGISQQIQIGRDRAATLRGQIGADQGLLAQAQAQGNVQAINDLTAKIQDLTAQVAEANLQTQQLITAYRQVSVTILQSTSQSRSGLIGAAQTIFQTLGQISGSLNLPAQITNLRNAAVDLVAEGAKAVKNIVDTINDPNGPFGANQGQANTFLSGAADAFNQGPTAFAAWLSSNAGLLSNFEAGLPQDQQALFQGLIGALVDNTTAQVTNTQQLQQLNATTNQQPFTSSAWTLFREAIFTGLGTLLPQYAMTVPSLDVGGVLTSSGLLFGHKDEMITPASVNRGMTPGNTTYHNSFNIDHPVEVADPVLFGNQVAWRLAHDPNSR